MKYVAPDTEPSYIFPAQGLKFTVAKCPAAGQGLKWTTNARQSEISQNFQGKILWDFSIVFDVFLEK